MVAKETIVHEEFGPSPVEVLIHRNDVLTSKAKVDYSRTDK